jgi:hypothetical protein
LSCNYCAPACSSKWAALQNIPFKSGTRPYYEAVCNFIEQHQEHVHEVALVGGEPLLLPENDRLLDVIPKSAIVTLITNLNIDLENNKIFKKLVQRNRVGWSMSFDNIGPRFEYVRYGSNWQLMKRNIGIVKDLMKTQGHWGGAHAVYNIYNATRLVEFRQFLADNEITVLWQNLFQPEFLDPFLHGKLVATLAASEIEKFYATGLPTNDERVFFDQALQRYQSITDDCRNITDQFKQHIADIETKYHVSHQGQFAKLWTEIYNLL